MKTTLNKYRYIQHTGGQKVRANRCHGALYWHQEGSSYTSAGWVLWVQPLTI